MLLNVVGDRSGAVARALVPRGRAGEHHALGVSGDHTVVAQILEQLLRSVSRVVRDPLLPEQHFHHGHIAGPLEPGLRSRHGIPRLWQIVVIRSATASMLSREMRLVSTASRKSGSGILSSSASWAASCPAVRDGIVSVAGNSALTCASLTACSSRNRSAPPHTDSTAFM